MTKFRAFLLGGACLGLFSLQASTDTNSRTIANAIKSRVAKLQLSRGDVALTRVAAADQKAEDSAGSSAGAAETPAPAAAEAPKVSYVESNPVPAVPGITWYPGETARAEDQPFSAPAQMMAMDDAPQAAEAPAAPAAEAPVFVPAPVNYVESNPGPAVPGVTWYPGETARAEAQPFSAPATVYAVAEAPPAAPVFVPAAINYVESNPGPAAPGVTWYPGETKRAEEQPFSAPAKMMMTAAPATAPAASTPVAAACRDQLNATVQSGRILFANSSWDIRDESFKTLDKLASIAKGCSGVVIEIGGHTDNTGKPASNEELSRLRAEAVSKYLARAGVDAAKLKAAGYGQTQPLATNTTPEGRQKNRRIEFLVTGG